MIDVLFTSAWIGPAVCFALWLSDYQLTVIGAKLYKAQDKVLFGGSYELNPLTAPDVDALRRFGFRIVFKPICIAAFVGSVYMLTRPGDGPSGPYALVLGAFVLSQLAIHFRHARNLYFFRQVAPRAEGRIAYPRGWRGSALELAAFTLLFLFLYLVTESPFILGGAVMCGVNAGIHYRLAVKHDGRLRETSGGAACARSRGAMH